MEGFDYEENGARLELPPGFRFHPTDEEIIRHYLMKKVMDRRFVARAIGEADLNKCEPWDLPKKAKIGEKEWFFFCQKDRKYPTGLRTNRATESGYWKATGKDKEIYKDKNHIIGMKKTLVFYKGRAPKGEKTNWVIHEYRLEGHFPTHNFSRAAKDEWVVCKVFDKSSGFKKINQDGEVAASMDSLIDFPTLPPLKDYPFSVQSPVSDIKTNGDKFIGNISSSKLPTNYPQAQTTEQDQKIIFLPTQNNSNLNISSTFSSLHKYVQNPILYPQITLPHSAFPHQQLSSVGYLNQACKIEQFSINNSVVCHSQDTGTSRTSEHSMGDIENTRTFDEELEDFAFSPNVSDLDSLWSY